MESIFSNLPNDIIMKIIKEATLSDTTEYWNREKTSQHINIQNKINNILTRISFIVRDCNCYNRSSKLIKKLGISTIEPIFSSELILNTMSPKYKKIIYHIVE